MRLEAKGLAIGYDGAAIADGIDFAVSPGETHCLLGPNGSGKTTLFKTLLGLIPALGGEVLVDGAPLEDLSARERATRIAYVPQQHAPPFPYLGLDVVLMGRQAGAGLFASPSKADRERAMAALDQLGIAHLAGADYSRLSGGQRQLVLIARALAQDAGLLIFDEPTASLDYGNQVRVLREVGRLSQEGYAVVLSTHNPDHVLAIGGRVSLLADGGMVASGPAGTVMTAEALSALYGIGITVERLAGGATVCSPDYGRAER